MIKCKQFKIIFCFIFLVGISQIKISHGYPFDDHNLELNEFKKELYASILDDANSDDLLDQSNESDNKIQDQYYQAFFFNLINEIENDPISLNEFVLKKKVNSKQKRFIKGLFDKLKPKNKTTTTKPHVENDDNEYDFDITEDPITTSTTKSFSTTKSKVILSSSASAKTLTPSSKISTNSGSSITDDVFFKLKHHCKANYDKLCITKKAELKDLVKKCDGLKFENKGKHIDACKDVLSIYCYVFYETFTCFGEDYDPYVPGRKQFSSNGTTTVSSSTKRILIETGSTKSQSTTKSPITTTTKTVTTTKAPTKPSIAVPKPTSKPSSNNDLVSPFDGPVNSIPKDAEKLTQIGNYCLKTKQKDKNCDNMLALLKDKFKTCEKKPKTDSDCQVFKVQFCSAFKNFPCCPDVLAGRTCAGKSNSLRRNFLKM